MPAPPSASYVTHLLGQSVTAAPVLPFTAVQLLTILMTTESLLFAGLSAIVALTAPTEHGRSLATSGWTFGLFVVCVITFASIGAGFVWWHLFSGPFSTNASTALGASAIAAVIVAVPLCALWAALALRGA